MKNQSGCDWILQKLLPKYCVEFGTGLRVESIFQCFSKGIYMLWLIYKQNNYVSGSGVCWQLVFLPSNTQVQGVKSITSAAF